MTIPNPVIYIDESGNLTDPKDPFVVVAALIASQHNPKLNRIIKKERQRLRMSKGKRKREGKLVEFKFRTVGDRTRRNVLQRLGAEDVELFLVILNKGDERIADTPENYARLVWSLLQECLARYPEASVVIDSHFNLIERREAFDLAIERKAGRHIVISHGDSSLDARLGLADFVAGAVLYRCRKGVDQFEKLFKTRVISEKVITWKPKKW